MTVTQHELDILRAAKHANPHWFKAIQYCAEIMVPRRRKYSGDRHSFYNFFDLGKRTGLTLWQVFLFYINIKLSRLGVGSIEDIEPLGISQPAENGEFIDVRIHYTPNPKQYDFKDDPSQDSWADCVNYAALALGALLDHLTEKDIKNYQPTDPYAFQYVWPTIGVDFDGVLNMQEPWNGKFRHFPMREGAEQFLRTLKGRGYCVVIHTARPDIAETWQWLEDNSLIDHVDDVTNIKPPCVAYIDDRALTFCGNYDDVLYQLENFQAHWEKKEVENAQ